MDTKNIIAAISLSAAVIILYTLFFQPAPKEINNQVNQDENIISNNSEAPSLELEEETIKINRNDALSSVERLIFENKNVRGSISLKGAVIDDLKFKSYTTELNGDKNITLLNPREVDDGYLVETGWASNSKNIDLPNSNTIWNIEGNTSLRPSNPITLTWTNDQKIKFTKKISIDDQFLFTVKQSIKNSTNNKYNFYAYGQIIRNKAPEITNFYILHEGLLGVFDDNLIEEDYDDIKEKKYSITANSGWLGITDKYWITSLIPQEGEEFKADFDYKKKFRANFIETNGKEALPSTTISNEIKIKGNKAIITGNIKFKSAELMATDLRASVSLVLAALCAEGKSKINRIYHLERGYEGLEKKLRKVGSNIRRIS